MFEADRSLGSHRWHVVRLAPSTKAEVVLLSLRFFEVTTHWVDRTVLCSGLDCPLCELLASRGLFYVAVHCFSEVRLLELGAQSASHLEQHCKLLHGGMKSGQVLSLSRRTAKSPVYSEVVRFQENASSVSELTLAARVMALYKFPPPNPGETLETYEARIHASSLVRNKRIAADLVSRSEKRGVYGR